MQCMDAIQDACSMEIPPLGNGDLAWLSNKINDGDVQPSKAPYPMIAKFTMKPKKNTLKSLCSKFISISVHFQFTYSSC